MSRLGLIGLAVLCALLAVPAAASAHAQLVETAPAQGAQLERAPGAATIRFDEPVEANFGAVRVFDARGDRVDAGSARHPGGRSEEVAVDLRRGLGDGTYTVTYRVVSADSHPIAGGYVFTVGTGGPAPTSTVAELVDEGDAGPATDAAFGAARALSYLAIALLTGGATFLTAVWRPSLRAVAGAGAGVGRAAEPGTPSADATAGGWDAAAAAFRARTQRILLAAAGLGALASVLGVVLQGANAAGISFWSALDPQVIGDVLGTRFGTFWGLRALDFLALGAIVAAGAWSRRPVAAAAVVLLGFLVVSPALSGHAGASDPRALLLPADAVHVLAMSVWIGGIALLVLGVPAATRRLQPPDRTRLLAACIRRFSPLALGAVVALLATGVAQSIVHLESFGDLLDSAFGRAILIKVVLLLVLIGLGAHNRQRSRPALDRIAAEGGAPGRDGLLLRRSLRAELGLLVGVLAVTAALTAYAPPGATAGGPFSTSADLGPARMELTVDPARTGQNEIHLYLFDATDGTQYDSAQRVTMQLRLPARDIGPLEPRLHRAGPGHYVARRAQIAPAGDWQLTVAARVSDFEEHRARVEVPIR